MKKARVLTDCIIGAQELKPNQLVRGNEHVIDTYEKSSVLCTDELSIAYCESIGVKAVELSLSSLQPLETEAAEEPEQKV